MKKIIFALLTVLMFALPLSAQVYVAGNYYQPTRGTGLQVALGTGRSNNNGTIVSYPGGTLSLTASQTNYVYLNSTSAFVPAVNTTGFTTTEVPIAIIVTSGSAITTLTDVRTFFTTPTSSGGMIYPASGLAASTGTAWRTPNFSDVVALWACSGLLKSDGTCSAGGGGGSTLPNSTETQGGGADTFGDSPMYGGATAMVIYGQWATGTPASSGLPLVITQTATGAIALLVSQPTETLGVKTALGASLAYYTVAGSITSGTFTFSEPVVQTTTGATGILLLNVGVAGTTMYLDSTISGTADGSHTWVGSTSGAVFTPTGVPVATAAADKTDTWTEATSGATFTPTDFSNCSTAVGGTRIADCNFTGEQIVSAYGGLGQVFPRSIAGYNDAAYTDSSALDVNNLQILPYTNPGDTGNPDFFVQVGTSDSSYGFGCVFCAGTITNTALAFTASLNTTVAWLGTPKSAKLEATNLACIQTSGTWTADNAFHSGVALSGTNGSVLTCTTPYPVANDVIAVWKVVSGGTDTATFKIDGTPVDTWSDGAAGTISTLPASTSMWWGNRYAISSTPATHVYTITVTAGNFTVAFLASPKPQQPWLSLTYPKIYFGRTPFEVNGTVDGLLVTAVSQLATDGWTVQALDLDLGWPDTTSPISGGLNANRACPASVVGYPHPGNCGQTYWSWSYLTGAGKTPNSSGVGSFNGRNNAVLPQTGDYNATQVTNAADTQTSNTFQNGIQTLYSEDYLHQAEILRGSTSGGGTPQQADLLDNEFNDGTIESGVNGPGLPFETPQSYASLISHAACASALSGTRARVTDSTVTTPGSTIGGSGSNLVPAYCNGTNWVVDGGALPTDFAKKDAANTFNGGLQKIVTPSSTTKGQQIEGAFSGTPTVVHVQGTTSTGAAAYGSNVTAGNLLIAACLCSNNPVFPATVSDTLGNSWILAADDTTNQTTVVYYAVNTTTGADTVTFGASFTKTVIIEEYSGLAVTSVLDASTIFNNSGSPNPITVGPITTSTADFLYSVADTNAGSCGIGTLTANSPFTNRKAVGASNGCYFADADVQENTPTSYSATWANTITNGPTWGALLAFKVGAGSPQTADLSEWQYPDGTVLSGVNGVGISYDVPLTYSQLIGYITCSSSTEGAHAAVKDSTASTWGSTISGSGSNHVPAYCNGTNWVVY